MHSYTLSIKIALFILFNSFPSHLCVLTLLRLASLDHCWNSGYGRISYLFHTYIVAMVSIRVSVMVNLVCQLAWFWKKGKPPGHTIEEFSCSVYRKWKSLPTPIRWQLRQKEVKEKSFACALCLNLTGKFICSVVVVVAAAAAILHSYQNPVSLVSQDGLKTIDSVRIYRPPTQDWGAEAPIHL